MTEEGFWRDTQHQKPLERKEQLALHSQPVTRKKRGFLLSLNENQDKYQLLECANQVHLGKFHVERNFNLELVFSLSPKKYSSDKSASDLMVRETNNYEIQ